MPLETRDIRDVQIFYTGTFHGIKYENKDLDEMITNFENGVIARPYLNLDHNEKTTDEVKNFLNTMSLGTIDALRHDGDSLYADIKNVPKFLAELIQAGSLSERSIEVWPQYDTADGSHYHNVLEAVSFFGGNGVPALRDLNDVMSFYKDKEENKINHGHGDNDPKNKIKIIYKEKVRMEEITISKTEYEGLVKLKTEHEPVKLKLKTSEEEAEKLKTSNGEKDKKVTALEKDNKDLQKFKTEAEALAVKAVETEAGEYASKLIKDRQLMPKFKDQTIVMYKDAHAKGEDSLKAFKEQMDSASEVITGKDHLDADGNATEAGLMERITSGEVIAFQTTDEKYEAQQLLMKAKHISSSQARDVLDRKKSLAEVGGK